MLAENALSLAWRHWKLIGWGLTAAVLLALVAVRTDQRDDAREAAAAEAAAHALTVANYRAAAAQARADMIANVRRVEAEQRAINEEVSRDYQAALADARARADALRLRLDSAGADPGGAAEV